MRLQEALESEGVLVIAATNRFDRIWVFVVRSDITLARPYDLDPAVRRR